jgi:subtilisin family serine protease
MLTSLFRLAAATSVAALISPAGLPGSSVEDAQLDLAAAHAVSTGQGVTVAVLDTGVNARLPGLRGKVTAGPQFITGGTIAGWGVHGTEMASCVLHVAPGAHVLGIRVITDRGQGKAHSRDPIASGIDYAVAHGAKVISMSIGSSSGGFSSYDRRQAAAVQNAVAHGVVVVASSGNNGGPATAFLAEGSGSTGQDDESLPAMFTPVIAVGAVGANGERASFSTVHAYVSVSAPGVSVPALSVNGTPTTSTGTSPAGALVAGVAALIVARHPGLAPFQVAEAMESTARHPAGGWNSEVGYGVVNAAAALRAAVAMSPAAASQPQVAYTGSRYYGQGPAADQLPARPLFATARLMLAIVFAAIGFGLAGCAVLLYRRGRRAGPGPAVAPVRAGMYRG